MEPKEDCAGVLESSVGAGPAVLCPLQVRKRGNVGVGTPETQKEAAGYGDWLGREGNHGSLFLEGS